MNGKSKIIVPVTRTRINNDIHVQWVAYLLVIFILFISFHTELPWYFINMWKTMWINNEYSRKKNLNTGDFLRISFQPDRRRKSLSTLHVSGSLLIGEFFRSISKILKIHDYWFWLNFKMQNTVDTNEKLRTYIDVYNIVKTPPTDRQ